MVNLRVGGHKSFDRFVIDLRGKMPGYDVRFVNSLVYDGSGEPVPLKGKRFVSVVLKPASARTGVRYCAQVSGRKRRAADLSRIR